MTKVYILDVGHGNSTVLIDTNGVLVVDAGSSFTLLAFLEEKGIKKIDVFLISHADEDHIGGLIGILSENIEIGRIFLNSDNRDSKIWNDLLRALTDSKKRNKLGKFNIQLTTELTGTIDQGSVNVEVLAPAPALAAKGPGGNDLSGRRLTSHSISAVIRFIKNYNPFIFLAGDIDEIGLDNLFESNTNANAQILVFPHHGGNLGLNNDLLTERLCRNVTPQTIIFSIGRGHYETPQPRIITKIREILPSVNVVCTELSKLCSLGVPSQEPSHLTLDFARGRATNSCCAGTILIELGDTLNIKPPLNDHRDFVISVVPTALCS